MSRALQLIAERVADILSTYPDLSRAVDAFDPEGSAAHRIVVTRRAKAVLADLYPDGSYEVSVRSVIGDGPSWAGGTMPLLGGVPYHVVVSERSAIDRLGDLA